MKTKNMTQVNNFEGFEEIKPCTFKYGKVGDFIQGTLVGVREVNSNYGSGRVKMYDVKVSKIVMHDEENGEEIKVRDNSIVGVWGGSEMIDEPMKEIKVGQKLVVLYKDNGVSKKTKKAYKLKKVMIGEMDTTFNETVELEDIDFKE